MNEKLFSDEIRERERRRRRKGLLWGGASFFLHAVLFCVIVLSTPVKSLVLDREKKQANPAAELSADRIEQIADALSQARISELLRQLEALQTVLHNMDMMKDQLQKDYEAFAEKSSEDMKTVLGKMIDEAESAQNDAAAAQGPMIEKVREMLAEERQDLMDETRSKWLRGAADELVSAGSDSIGDAQARAANAFDRIEVQARFGGYVRTADASEKVRDAQIEAATMQNQAQKEASEIAYRMGDYRGRVLDLESHEKALERQRERLARAEQDRKDAQTQVADAIRLRESAEQERDDVQKGGDRKRLESANRKLKQETARAEREQRRLDGSERAIADAKKRISETEGKIAVKKESVRSLEKIRRTSVNEEQVEKLGRASKAQADIKSRIDMLRKILENDTPELEKLVQENREENKLVTMDTTTLKLADAYEVAKKIESAITESYKDIRATQTAIERKMSFDAAQKITDVAKSVRMDANRKAIEDSPRTKEALDAQKRAQAEVVRETDSIVESAVSMMAEAMTIVKPDDPAKSEVNSGSPKTVQWLDEKDFEKREQEEAREERLEKLNEMVEYKLAIGEAAAESEQERAKDIAKVMEDAVEVKKNTELADSMESVGANPVDEKPATLESLRGGMAGLVGGNIVRFRESPANDGMPAKWMYVQDWYVIGPFPNPNRVNLRRKFPPESVVDLDATYVGKDGRTIRWEFMQPKNLQSDGSRQSEQKAKLVPLTSEEYGIWYAYAEVFSDCSCDRWIAVGSDDRSDIWVNDVLVWGSSNKLKSWRVDEGYRRIHLNEGRNRILARIENGWRALSWSVCISIEEGDIER